MAKKAFIEYRVTEFRLINVTPKKIGEAIKLHFGEVGVGDSYFVEFLGSCGEDPMDLYTKISVKKRVSKK